ncbi:hypothetical protein PLEOSDRAFT_1113794 [Pleurotus ostreatus PC15]|uniref:Uncharacterized protein n=2 Tax=Pleurotus TaxID=5320 RepID=A0A067NBY0_PLEO1|nr:hypothetical protein CCMSSC00406_0002189 [Pleurotus cornucopiae]KDQ24455.1 hypothetical protein PLEOSDRAFT_1113794 [Pleurotus ostreatus PC15]
MFNTLITVSLLASLSIQGVFADFAVSQPEFTQCQEAKFSWQKTKGPYNILITKASDPCGDALADLGDFDSTTGAWKVALPAGIKVQLSIEDVDGEEAWTETITVKGSNDASCVPPALLALGSSSAVSSGAASTSTGSSSVPAIAVGGTTLVVPAATQTTVATSSVAPTPVGAANAGSDPFSKAAQNSASAFHTTSISAMVVSAVLGGLVLSL